MGAVLVVHPRLTITHEPSDAMDKRRTLDEVIAAVRTPVGTGSGHSPLYLWLWDNHDRLAEELSAPHQPNWQEMAATLGRLGILDGTGKPPTATRLRKTWWKIGQDKQAVAAGTTRRRGRPKEAATPPTVPVLPAPPSVPAATPKPRPADPLVDDPFAGMTFAGPKKWT